MLLHDIATRAAIQRRLSEQSPQHHRFTLDFSDLFSRVFESLVVFCRPVVTTTFGMCSHHVIVFFFSRGEKRDVVFKK
jgi:hypothetical protein